MRRWLAIFLLVFLPFQLSWAVLAGYCQHESGAAAQHAGHHEHQHSAGGDGSADTKALGGIDGDCAACHAGCMAVLAGMAQIPVVLPAFEGKLWRLIALPSPPSAVPERPKWAVSA